MDTEASLSPFVLLRMKQSELALYFRELAAAVPKSQPDGIDRITAQLQEYVHSESIPPIVFGIWFPLAERRSPSLIRTALLDRLSCSVRSAGIRALKRALDGSSWKENGWDPVGGAEGLKEVFDMVGVREVKKLVNVLRRCNGARDPAKAAAIEELAQLLMPSLFSFPDFEDWDMDNTQQRSLLYELGLLVQAGSTSFLTQLLSKPLPETFHIEGLLGCLADSHPDILRGFITGGTKVQESVRKMSLNYLEKLINSCELYEPQYRSSSISPTAWKGLHFLIDLIHITETSPSLSSPVIRDAAKYTIKLAVRRKVPFSDILALLESAVFAAERRKDGPDLLDFLPREVVLYWALASFPDADVDSRSSAAKRLLSHPSRPASKYRDDLYNLMIRIIKACSKVDIKGSEFCRYLDGLFTSKFPMRGRLPTIKTLCRYLPGVGIDLDAPSLSEKERLQKWTWDVKTLNQLPFGDAKWLFERATSMTMLQDSITYRYAGSPWSSDQPKWYQEGLLKVQWEAQSTSGDNNPLALKLLEEVRKRAERDRDQDKRLVWAKRAIDIALLSSSIGLLESVVTWTRRFLRDPAVGPPLYQYISNMDASSVLSYVELPPRRYPSSLADLISHVHKSNAILSFNIQTAILGKLEPGFQSHGYELDNSLIKSVLSFRIVDVRHLCRIGVGSEEDLANVLLGSMKPILLEYDSTRATEEALTSWHLRGALKDLPSSGKPPQYALRFLDDLARSRDTLWAEERIKREPAVTMLEEGWPRGLPVQYLLPSEDWAFAALAVQEAAPFVSARVKDLVFCDSRVALVSVPHDRHNLIGPFCDKLRFAIRSYVGENAVDDRAVKILKIWEHYSKPMSGSTRHIESFREWLIQFSRLDGQKKIAKLINDHAVPTIQFYDNSASSPTEPIEWDPRPHGSAHVRASAEPIVHSADSNKQTLLQCRFFNLPKDGEHPPWKVVNESGPGVLHVWQSAISIRKLPVPTQEALVVSALLYLDSLTTGSPRLLSKSFPENAWPARYPSLYLDYEFLSAVAKEAGAVYRALDVLRKLVKTVPPTLLHDLANSLLKTLIACSRTSLPKYSYIQSALMGVINLISFSDRPELAIDLGLKLVEDVPDGSSWHRYVFSLALGLRVTSEGAEEMLHKFASLVFHALEKQRLSREAVSHKKTTGTENSTDDGLVTTRTPVAPIIKITTVKMLAQLLAQNNFVSPAVSLHILRALFAASHHIDVRSAVVLAVLAFLQKSGDIKGGASDEAYDALKSFSAPAAKPNERVALSEDDWSEAEKGGPLPEVAEDRPLLELFLKTAKNLLPEKLHEPYVRDVILPLLTKSTEQHNRWMRIFLSRIELTRDESSVSDFGPFDSDAVRSVFETWTAYLDSDYLYRHRVWALSHLECRKLEGISDKLDTIEKGWRGTNAGEHWLTYFQRHKACVPFSHLKSVLLSDYKTKIANGITKEQVMDEYSARVAIIVRNPFEFKDLHSSVSLTPFESACKSLQNREHPKPGTTTSTDWRASFRLLLQRIVADAESLRTSGWLEQPNRSPVILPPRIFLQSLLLPYPHCEGSTPKHYESFARATDALVRECASSPSSVSDFTILLDAMDLVEKSDLLLSALAIASIRIEEHSQPTGCMKVRLAHKLLLKMNKADRERSKKASGLIEGWKKSPSEWVRSMAWYLDPNLKRSG